MKALKEATIENRIKMLEAELAELRARVERITDPLGGLAALRAALRDVQ